MPLNGRTKDLAWLSPKRSRTTGNLRTVANGQSEITDTSPINQPVTPGNLPEQLRPVSQSNASDLANPTFPDGNLFYAYARRGNDLKSRYLLTFASASVANEWSQLLQTNFRGTARAGPQLFSVSGPETLAKAWQHPKFEHLKSKWMYISFSDTTSSGLGAAAQGIIPVQDVQGNMLGGGSSTGMEVYGDMRREHLETRNDMARLEEKFERLMAVLEKNASNGTTPLTSKRQDYVDGERNPASDDEYLGTVMPNLTDNITRSVDIAAMNAKHLEGLAHRQLQQEQRLNTVLEGVAARQEADDLNLGKLSSHLDRIQNLMEKSIERNTNADTGHVQAPQIDFSPLTDRLEKVQEAMEQNSALIKALLEEGTEASKPSTPFWGKETTVTDLSPLTEHLENIKAAIEQQSIHMQALVGFASVDDSAPEEVSKGHRALSPIDEKVFAPLGEQLELIHAAITEGNQRARENAEKPQSEVKLESTNTRLDALVQQLKSLRDVSEEHMTQTRNLVQLQDTSNNHDSLGEKMDEVNEHLQCLREWTEYDSHQLAQLLETQKNAYEHDTGPPEWTTHFPPMRQALEQNLTTINSLLEGRSVTPSALATSSDLDLTPVTERLTRIHESLEKQLTADPIRGNKSPSTSGTGDARFLLSALTSHLSKIQAVTDQNAQQTGLLRDRLTTAHEKLTLSLKDSAAQIQTLAASSSGPGKTFSPSQQQRFEQRLEATSSQVRELMSGHREMLDVMREVARSLAAAGVRGCEHIVVPPPRKMGRKVVGFVYDAKDEGIV